MTMTGLAKELAKALVRAYRVAISPLLGPACRFEPSCSQYALDALEKHGCCAGTGFLVWRLLRCHPWCQGGYDPA